jgi:histone-lysine N-methyltransferase SETMAR
MLISGVVFLYDNARQHTAARIRGVQEHLNWELFDHLPYSLDLVPSGCHLFTRTYLEKWLESERFNNNEESMEGVKTWLTSGVADFFDTGKQTLILRHDMCLNSAGDYTEKWLKYVCVFYIQLFFSHYSFC